MNSNTSSLKAVSIFVCWMMVLLTANSAELKLGIIGLDTSHVTAFTRLINDPSHPDHLAGGKVVAAFKGGSPDIPSSADRIDGFTRQLQQEMGVEIVPSIEDLCRKVDAVLLESVDGRPHLEQARPVILAGKPLFIDKPLAGSLKDAVEIMQLAEKHGVPVFSSSSYRYYSSLTSLLKKDAGEIRSVISYGPCSLESHRPDLFWYGIHPVEALFTVLGPGCETVSRTSTENTDIVTGVWSDGRVGNLHGIRNGKTPHGVIVFGTKDVLIQGEEGGYAPLVKEIMTFFQTGKSPVEPLETLNIYAFMEAADASKREGGKPVSMNAILKNAGWTP